MSDATSTEPLKTTSAGFRFDTSKVPWRDFLTDGCYYQILDVNVAAHTADMIVKFDPGARCLFHRHVAATTTLVLEGSLHVFDQTADGVVEKVKPAGFFSSGAENEIHIEGGGDDGVVVYFSMRGKDDHIYDLLNPDLTLRRAITVQDFAHDWEHWTKP
ncbi:MAG: cupin domain-containing protein [Candidatus Binataceae bacterium]